MPKPAKSAKCARARRAKCVQNAVPKSAKKADHITHFLVRPPRCSGDPKMAILGGEGRRNLTPKFHPLFGSCAVETGFFSKMAKNGKSDKNGVLAGSPGGSDLAGFGARGKPGARAPRGGTPGEQIWQVLVRARTFCHFLAFLAFLAFLTTFDTFGHFYYFWTFLSPTSLSPSSLFLPVLSVLSIHSVRSNSHLSSSGHTYATPGQHLSKREPHDALCEARELTPTLNCRSIQRDLFGVICKAACSVR